MRLIYERKATTLGSEVSPPGGRGGGSGRLPVTVLSLSLSSVNHKEKGRPKPRSIRACTVEFRERCSPYIGKSGTILTCGREFFF